VIEHELLHRQQKYSQDLLFSEVLKIVMWFNPMIYVYQKRITLLHEYISDAVVVKSGIKETYINNILSSLFQVENISFVNQFYKQSLIKKRIMMMTKTQSQKMNQLKYLLLIPVLASMLFYSACSENESNLITESKKEMATIYTSNNGKLSTFKTDQKSYLDSYIGLETPSEFTKVSFSELDTNEKNEYNNLQSKLIEQRGKDYKKLYNHNFYKYKSRIVLGVSLNSSYKVKVESSFKSNEIQEFTFMTIDKAPTFPGCEDGDKKCFSEKIQLHFAKEFNTSLPNTLGLASGSKRIITLFKIDKQGNVADIKVKAPHKDLEAEATRVINMLPIMTPGEHDGKTVHVKYTLPLRIDIQ
jgi:hypothetical protein